MMLGRSSQGASSTLMSKRCSISTQRCSSASSRASRSLRFPVRIGLQDQSDDWSVERQCPPWVRSGIYSANADVYFTLKADSHNIPFASTSPQLSHAPGVNQPLRFFNRFVPVEAIELERN